MLSVLVAAGSLVLFGFVVRRVYRSDLLAATGIFFLIMDSSLGLASRTARMDILIFFFLVGMVWVMLHEWIWAGGMVAALAVLTHPLGLLVPAAGLLFLAKAHTQWRRTLRRSIVYLAPSCIALAAWFVSMGKNISSFIAQFRLQFTAKSLQESDLVTSFQEDRLWQAFFIIAAVTLLVQGISAVRCRKKNGSCVDRRICFVHAGHDSRENILVHSLL